MYINLSLKKKITPEKKKKHNISLSLYASGFFFSFYRVYPKIRWYHWAAPDIPDFSAAAIRIPPLGRPTWKPPCETYSWT